jgi:hypothetical protein
MDRLSALSRGAQIMLGAGVLLFIDLFLPWQDFDVGGIAEELGVDASFNAWHGFWGWMLGLLTIVLLAWLVVRIAAVDVPLPVSSAMLAGLLGTLILFFAVIKNLVDDESTIWSYIGVLLAIALAYGAWMQIQEAGGIDTLKTEASSMRPPASGTTETTAPSEPAAPPSPPPSSAPSGTTTPTETAPPPPSAPPSPPPPPGETPPASDEPRT